MFTRSKKSQLESFVDSVLPKQKSKNRKKKVAIGATAGAALAVAATALVGKKQVPK